MDVKASSLSSPPSRPSYASKRVPRGRERVSFLNQLVKESDLCEVGFILLKVGIDSQIWIFFPSKRPSRLGGR